MPAVKAQHVHKDHREQEPLVGDKGCTLKREHVYQLRETFFAKKIIRGTAVMGPGGTIRVGNKGTCSEAESKLYQELHEKVYDSQEFVVGRRVCSKDKHSEAGARIYIPNINCVTAGGGWSIWDCERTSGFSSRSRITMEPCQAFQATKGKTRIILWLVLKRSYQMTRW